MLAGVFKSELNQYLDEGLINLLRCFVDRSIVQYCPEETAITGSQDAVDPLYSFFTQSFKDTS